jgi:hypothetical protein
MDWLPRSTSWAKDGRNVVHSITALVLFGIGLTVVVNPTLHSSLAYRWFLAHWPYTEQGWGALFASLGGLGFVLNFVQNKYSHLLATTFVCTGHLIIFQGLLISNPISTGPIAYTGLACLSFWVFWRVLDEEKPL